MKFVVLLLVFFFGECILSLDVFAASTVTV